MRKTKGRQRGRIVQLIIALLLIVLVGVIVTRFSEHGNGQGGINAPNTGSGDGTATSVAEKPTPTPKPKQGTIVVTVSEEESGLPVAGVEVVFEPMSVEGRATSGTVGDGASSSTAGDGTTPGTAGDGAASAIGGGATPGTASDGAASAIGGGATPGTASDGAASATAGDGTTPAVGGGSAPSAVTDADGKATSPLLDYGTSHRIVLAGGPNAYDLNVTESTIAISAPTQKADYLLGLKEHVKEIVRADDGTVSIAKVFMRLPVIMQKPELPNGCEITSLTAVLNFYGYPADKLDMADNYLPKQGWARKDGKLYGADPYIAYAGNPRDQPGGFFSFAPPIVEAAETYIADNGGTQTVKDISGSTREELVALLMEGIPIVAWTTLDLSPPKVTYSWNLHTTGELYNAPVNLHVVVLNGYDVETNTLHVMNPLVDQVTYDADKFFASYEGMGSHALIVEP